MMNLAKVLHNLPKMFDKNYISYREAMVLIIKNLPMYFFRHDISVQLKFLRLPTYLRKCEIFNGLSALQQSVKV
jgi:hypothetical protein